jgi:hypothetical protein
VIRKCEHIISSEDGKKAIYVDSGNKEQILGYISRDERHRRKFQYITDIILGGHKNTAVYDKEDINQRCKDVTAMKFFKGQENDRIYCKEIHSEKGTFIVITSILHERKKNSRLSAREIALIEKVGGYHYEV